MSDTKFNEISADLVDFVSKMTQSIADAQSALDINSVEMLKFLANEPATIPKTINHIKEIKDNNGNVTDIKSRTETVFSKTTLLNLGITPTFYQFSKTTLEVALDLQYEEEETTQTDKKKRLLVSTKKIRQERRLNTNIHAYSKLSVELVPVPMPINLPELVTNEVSS